ncbi:TonB-dependent receptor [Colwellia sp. UCD-KL20]|uniref:TonB-dependent receptor domain-containing protein n=1 Tax=Colwellia sp. UCD-KL20 TaxID=1917165 RepID=UPI0009706001|nr:TonB-dependent receptor [Colwellia sp. UCD-KL20]
MLQRLNAKKIFNTSLLSTAILMACNSAYANENTTKKDENVEMIVVVGQATSGLDRLINQEDLEKIQANSLADIFRLDTSINVSGSVGMGQKIYLRNVGEDLLNISVDGAEQAEAVFHHSGRISIEPELLKQVEIEAGTGSATAGPGALGGTVRLTTKDPLDLLAENERAGALVKASYFSNGGGMKYSATVFGSDEDGMLSAMASFVTSDFDNADDGNGNEIAGTNSDKDLGYVKVVANLSESQYLSLSHENLKEEGDILYRPELIESPKNFLSQTEGARATTVLNYGLDDINNDLLDFSINVYQTKQEQERYFRDVSYDGAVKSVGVTLQNKSQINTQQLVYGFNYRKDESSLNDIDFAPNSHFEEGGNVKGLFVQDVVKITHKLTLSAGLRFDDYELNDINGLHFTDNGFSPNISLNYQLSEQLSVSTGYAEALRGPKVKDSFKLSSYSNDESLTAEKAKNLEIGLDYITKSLEVGVGVYRSDIVDPIGGAAPWSKVAENLDDDIETLGYYLQLAYHLDAFNLYMDFNSADTEINNETVTRYVYGSSATSMGDNLIIDLNYEFSESFSAGWVSQVVSGIHNINLNVGGESLSVEKPGYSVHDVYARWSPLSNDALTLNLTAKNLFNKQYLGHASVEDFTQNAGYGAPLSVVGSPSVGRDIRLSLSYRF